MTSDDLVLPTLLARRAAEQPDRVFIQEAGGGTLTFGEFSTDALTCAAVLRDLGVEPGDRVLVMLPSTRQAYGVWVGIGWVRAIEVAVNGSFRGEMLRYIVNHSRARVAVVGAEHLPRWRQILHECPELETIVVIGDTDERDLPVRVEDLGELLAAAEPAQGLEPPRPWDTAAIMYTSGTTGPSKGVIVPWAQLHATASNNVPGGLTSDDRLYSPFPFAHVSAKAPLYTMLLAGGSIVFRETFSTTEFWPDIRKYECSIAMVLFTMARFLMNQPETESDRDHPLRTFVMVPALPDVDDFRRRFGVEVTTLFNMTEIAVPLVSPGDVVDPASCGRVRAGVEVRVVDEHDNEVPVGEVGELILRADEPWTLNAGYWDMPAQTAEAWRNGWFHTGDGFRRNKAGDFYFVDRFKDAIRRRGENISSMELENAVARHTAVAECAAVGVASEFGEQDVRIFVVPREEGRLDAAELHAWLLDRLPKFMVPRFIDVVDSLPRTATAKVRKLDLRSVALGEGTWEAPSPAAREPRLTGRR